MEIVEVGFAVCVEVDVEIGRESSCPFEQAIVDSSYGVFHIEPFLLGGCCTVQFCDYLMRDN